MNLPIEQILDQAGKFFSQIQGCDRIKAADPGKKTYSDSLIDEMGRLRGRPLIYPMMPTGKGAGPFIEMADGSVKMDLISGIGVFLFGHGHPELTLTSLRAAVKATSTQGTLMPGKEYLELSKQLLKLANNPGHLPPEGKGRFEASWLTTCGTMANELALKVLRQKKVPHYKVIGFKNCFAGRSTAMQELTDEPKYREGQPLFDQFSHIDFFDASMDMEKNITRTCSQIDELLSKDKYCGLSFEPVQGEGAAFRSAPREWWVAVLSHARKKDLGIWFDEVQTFGRTGEAFAFQRLGLGEFCDVLSCAKPLHCGAILWTKDFAPKPGLIAGTFAGSTVALALGTKIMHLLESQKLLGPEGRVQAFERHVLADWETRKKRLNGAGVRTGATHVTGAMICFEVLDGTAESVKKLLNRLFERGLIAFSAGKSPVMLRFLPPIGVLSDQQWSDAMDIVEETLREFV